MFKKIRNILAPISTLILFSVFNFAHAQLGIIESFSINGIAGLGSWVLFMAGTIFSNLVTFGGTLVNWSLNLNSSVLTSQTVQVGWIISRDLANLGFVLTILIIAFATILRVGGYQTKQLLFKLIAAAILVNFSLVFAGVLLDFSGMLTNYFLAQATGGNSGNVSELGAKLADSFGIQKLLLVKKDTTFINNQITSITSDVNSSLLFFASLFFIVAFTSICAITLLGLAAMFFIRYIWLTMLLILMPVACLLWIWPETQGQWSKWWGEFLKWVWFGPAATFWIYIALSIATNGDAYNLAGTEQFQMAGILDNMTAMQNFGGIIGQMIAVIGILIGGMMTAEKMGGYGSKISTDLATGLKNKALGGAGWIGGATVGRLAARKGAEVFGDNQLVKGMQTFGATRGTLLKGITQPVRALGNLASDIPKFQEKIIDGYAKDLKEKDYDADELGTRIHAAITDEERMAYLRLLDEKGGVTGDHIQYLHLAKKYDQKLKNTIFDKDILDAAKSGKTEDLKKKIGAKLSNISSENIGKTPIAKLLVSAKESKLRGGISEKDWETMQDALIDQIAEGKIKGERVGKLYEQLTGDDFENFHTRLTKSLRDKMVEQKKDLKDINSGLAHYFESNSAKRLGLSMPLTLQPPIQQPNEFQGEGTS